MTDVLFPALSSDGTGARGVLTRWFVRDGQRVDADQLVAEVQLDKVDAEVLSPAAGRIRLSVDEGTEVVEGTTIATVA